MLRARVIGEVWATKKCPGLQGHKLRIVAPVQIGDDPTNGNCRVPSGQVVVAMDLLDSRIGEDVVVAFGSGARNALRPGASDNYDLLVDAALVQITDQCFSEE